MRNFRRCVPLLVILLCRCAQPPGAGDTDDAIYARALDVLYRETESTGVLRVHPRPANMDLLPDSTVNVTFSTFADSLVIPRVLARNARYSACATGRSQSCYAPADSPYVVLSEVRELGDEEAGIGAMVSRQSEGMRVNDYYGIRLRRGFLGWRVASVARFH